MTRVKVGLTTGTFSATPSPFAIPWVRQVLPDPSSPMSATMSPLTRKAPIRRPISTVCSRLSEISFKINSSLTDFPGSAPYVSNTTNATAYCAVWETLT